MNVIGNAGTRRLADVHSDVEGVGFDRSPQYHDGVLGHRHHLGRRLGRQFLDRIEVLVGDNHQMPGRVRVGIEHAEIVLSSREDQVCLIVMFSGFATENAPRGFFPLDESHAPGGPKAIHQWSVPFTG